jgi:hypothetical protein
VRVALVTALQGRREPPVMPLGPGVLASGLEGHEVMILDPNTAEDPTDRLVRGLSGFRPDVVGLSMRNVDTTQSADRWSYLPPFTAQVAAVRKTCPGALLVVGGAGFSLFPEAILSRLSGVDAAVFGEAEEALPRIVDDFARGRAPGRLAAGGPQIPLTPRYDLMDVGSYRGWEGNLSIGVEVSRGCDRLCTYCCYPRIGGPVVRYRMPAEVAGDMEALHAGWGVGHVFLVSPLLNSDPGRAREVFAEIIARRLPVTWEGYFGPAGLDRDLVALAVRSGCTGMSISADAGTLAGMRRLGKGFSPADVEHAIDTLRGFPAVRLSMNIFPLVPGGGPLEMPVSFLRGARWAARAGRSLSRMRYGTIRLVPGTPLAGGLGEEELLDPVFVEGRGPVRMMIRTLSRLLGRGLRCSRR